MDFEIQRSRENKNATCSCVYLGIWLKTIFFHTIFIIATIYTKYPGDLRTWESPQTLPALFIGPFEHVERFRNLKFAVKRITNIKSTVLSSFEGTATIHLAFK